MSFAKAGITDPSYNAVIGLMTNPLPSKTRDIGEAKLLQRSCSRWGRLRSIARGIEATVRPWKRRRTMLARADDLLQEGLRVAQLDVEEAQRLPLVRHASGKSHPSYKSHRA